MDLTQKKMELIKKILNAKLSNQELKQISTKAQNLINERKND